MELDYQEFTALFTRFDREAIHLEMRDSYGTAVDMIPSRAPAGHSYWRWAMASMDEPRTTVRSTSKKAPLLSALRQKCTAPDNCCWPAIVLR